jgi:adenylate kinase family enzyme
MNLRKKILVVGISASGKSVFSRELSKRTSIPVVYVDALMWKPGWNYIGKEEIIKLLDEASQDQEWIIEGFIHKQALPFMLERATAIIYLDYPRLVVSWRYIKRSWIHRRTPRPELEGSPDKFSFKFLIKIWSKKEVYWLDRYLKEMSDQTKLIKLATLKQAKSFFQKI